MSTPENENENDQESDTKGPSSKSQQWIIEDLKSGPENRIRNAMEQISGIEAPSDGIIFALIGILVSHSEKELREQAYRVLGGLELSTRHIGLLKYDLTSYEPDIQQNVASLVVKSGQQAIPELVPILIHRNNEKSTLAHQLLDRIDPLWAKTQGAVICLDEIIESGLRSNELAVRKKAAAVMVKVGVPAVPWLLPLITHPFPHLRTITIGTLDRINGDWYHSPELSSYYPDLVKSLEGTNHSLTQDVLMIVKKIGKPIVPQLLQEFISGEKPFSKSLGGLGLNILKVLSLIRDQRPEVLSLLAEVLSSEGDSDYLLMALRAIQKIGVYFDGFYQGFERSIRDDVSRVRLETLRTVHELHFNNPDFYPFLIARLADKNTDVAEKAKVTVRGVGQDIAPALWNFLMDKEFMDGKDIQDRASSLGKRSEMPSFKYDAETARRNFNWGVHLLVDEFIRRFYAQANALYILRGFFADDPAEIDRIEEYERLMMKKDEEE